MPIFSYVAKDAGGKSVRAQESASSEQELKIRLSRRNLVIISISDANRPARTRFAGSKIKTAELVIFCKQLATMVKGGVPLLKAINSISDETRKPLFKATLE